MQDTAQNGKGSSRRPTNTEWYHTNHDRIFGKEAQHEATQQATVDLLDFHGSDQWRPASNGTAKPFHWNDKEYVYMYNVSSGSHAYFNATDDVFESESEFM